MKFFTSTLAALTLSSAMAFNASAQDSSVDRLIGLDPLKVYLGYDVYFEHCIGDISETLRDAGNKAAKSMFRGHYEKALSDNDEQAADQAVHLVERLAENLSNCPSA